MQENNTNSSEKVVKAGAGYVIGNYLLKGITVLSAPIFANLLTTAEFGDFSTYISYEAIVYVLVGMALHSSVNNAKYKYREKLDEYISSIITLISLSTVIWLIAGNLLYNVYAGVFGFDRLTANVLIIHCFASSLFQVYHVYVSLTYSVKEFIKVTAFNAIANIIISVILIVTVFSERRTTGRILGTVIPLLIISVYIIVLFFKKARPTVNKEFWRFGLGYSLPIVPHGISQVILSTFDRIMIRDMVGSSEAGIYGFAYTVYSLFKVACTSLENVWKPWVYERMDEKDYDSIRKQGTNYAFGMALFTALVMIVSPELIKILSGGEEDYWGATACVIPVLLGGFFSFLYTLPSVIEYYYGKTSFIAIGTMSAAAINVGLNYVFIMKYGYIAAAYTTLVTYLLYFAFHYILARKIHGSAVFETGHMLLISVGIILVGAFVLVTQDNWIVRWLVEIALGIYSLIWANKRFDAVNMIKKKLGKA